MSPILLIAIAAFVGVSALVGGLTLLLRPRPNSRLEERLDVLTGAAAAGPKDGLLAQAGVLTEPLDAMPGLFETILNRFGDVGLVLQQADVSLGLSQLALISAMLGLGGAGVAVFLQLQPLFVPLVGLLLAVLPVLWVVWRRRRRLRAFGTQLPDALDMLGRALRAGQSLGAGFNLVASEVAAPLGKEFGRVAEEQNLGVNLEEALQSLTQRVPNLDLKFFCTALLLQRQTGGDLAEILDKIAHLIRERFQIWGQVQALTGEGRLSGVVLLALPVVLLLAVYRLNPDYVMVLFSDPMGKKMLGVAVVLQVLGALVIRKIVNIKV